MTTTTTESIVQSDLATPTSTNGCDCPTDTTMAPAPAAPAPPAPPQPKGQQPKSASFGDAPTGELRENELKMVLCVNAGLSMGKGKIGACRARACFGARRRQQGAPAYGCCPARTAPCRATCRSSSRVFALPGVLRGGLAMPAGVLTKRPVTFLGRHHPRRHPA